MLVGVADKSTVHKKHTGSLYLLLRPETQTLVWSQTMYAVQLAWSVSRLVLPLVHSPTLPTCWVQCHEVLVDSAVDQPVTASGTVHSSCWRSAAVVVYYYCATSLAFLHSTPHHRLLPHLNPDWFYLFGTGLPSLPSVL